MNHEPLPAQGPVDVLVSRLIEMHNNPPSKIGWVEQTTLRDACEMLAQMRRLLNELTIENVTYWDNTGEVRHDVGGSQAQAMQTFREARALLANAKLNGGPPGPSV